jgi:anti-sigma B factor antagonist
VELALSTREVGDRTVLAVGGEIDVHSAPELRGAVTEVVDGGVTALVVDLSAVQFLDSTGLGVLVEAHKALSETGGTLDVVCSSERLLKVFTITGLAQLFTIHDSVEAATS